MCNLNPTKDETSTDHNGWNRCWRYCRNVHHDEAFTFCLDQWLEPDVPCTRCRVVRQLPGDPIVTAIRSFHVLSKVPKAPGQVLLHVSCAPGWYRDRTAEAVEKLPH